MDGVTKIQKTSLPDFVSPLRTSNNIPVYTHVVPLVLEDSMQMWEQFDVLVADYNRLVDYYNSLVGYVNTTKDELTDEFNKFKEDLVETQNKFMSDMTDAWNKQQADYEQFKNDVHIAI